jgi:hypothetical protein
MIGHFNELLRATADEGASAAIGVSPSRTFEESDQLLDAWYRERQERVETGLFLEEASQLLKKIISEGRVTPASRRKVRRLLLAIEAAHPDT